MNPKEKQQQGANIPVLILSALGAFYFGMHKVRHIPKHVQ
jgi:hypothetical protein